MPHWTVGELTHHIKNLMETDPELQNVWLEGEVSNFTRAASGHLYFSLKDADAAIDCVMWRSAADRLTWQPERGAAVVARGHVSVYAPRGRYQFYVTLLSPAGLGDLHARFEELKERLKAEGLFDDERKRPIPSFPAVVGIVTSPQAAALQDVRNVLERRYPLVRVLLSPTLVQGEQAPDQIVGALQAIDALEEVDVLLVIRGGGSLEDLWAFNDERVARAIAACQHPVVSGVGHETDFTIADFVADLRAPTPSAAAELIVQDQADLRQRIDGWVDRLDAGIYRCVDDLSTALERQARALERLSPQTQLDTHRQQVDELARRAERAVAQSLALQQTTLSGLVARLVTLSPHATLERGYAIVHEEATGDVVRSVDQVDDGQGLKVRVGDGEFGAIAKTT
jgi:exodeoxyribonuclease VII large subunit